MYDVNIDMSIELLKRDSIMLLILENNKFSKFFSDVSRLIIDTTVYF